MDSPRASSADATRRLIAVAVHRQRWLVTETSQAAGLAKRRLVVLYFYVGGGIFTRGRGAVAKLAASMVRIHYYSTGVGVVLRRAIFLYLGIISFCVNRTVCRKSA